VTRSARAIALVAALGVAGLSSPLAICVAACTERNASEPAAHHCHDASSTRTTIQADSGVCAHTPVSVDGVKLARDPHPRSVIARVVWVAATVAADRVPVDLLRAARHSPAPSHTSPPILRI
jgi:hypothetical protein